MAASHNRLINHMQEKSLIREYCACSTELAQNYNQLLESYVDFHKLHGTFIRVFLACRIPVQTKSLFGVAFATLIDKYKLFANDQLQA